jgi:hypothetical protein
MKKTSARKIAIAPRTPARSSPARKPPPTERARKFEIGDRVVVNAKGPRDYRSREGFVTELGSGKSEYRVEFDDGRQPTTGYMSSSWLTAEP